MKYLIVSIIAIIIVSVVVFLPTTSYAEENPCRDFWGPIDLKYDIKNGTVNSVCYDKEMRNLVVSIKAVNSGKITIEIPRTIMNPISPNCDDSQFFVLINGEEILQDRKNMFGMEPFEETKSISSRSLEIPFKLESSEIEIIDSFVPETPQYEKMCKQKTNALPPKQQIMKGVLPEEVICKEGLNLIFKSKDNSPACVKLTTAEKLEQRGWATKISVMNNKPKTPENPIIVMSDELLKKGEILKANFTIPANSSDNI